VLEVSADERRRVGHELHDGLGQYLAGIAFKAKALEEMLARHESAHADKAHELVGLVSSAISQARDLARGLDPVEVETIGFGAALQNLCADTRKMFNVQCEFVPAQFPDVNPQTGLALYRIVQQAIHNACTHGRARAIRIELGVNNGEVVLAIRDDGRGFDSSRKFSTGMGLRVMRYRARSVGGDLTVYSEPGAGAEVRCTVPKIRS
jgi:signal transduction histidine kinase